MFEWRRWAAARASRRKRREMFRVTHQATGKDFHRDATTERLMNRFKDHAHSTATNFANDRVVIELFDLERF